MSYASGAILFPNISKFCPPPGAAVYGVPVQVPPDNGDQRDTSKIGGGASASRIPPTEAHVGTGWLRARRDCLRSDEAEGGGTDVHPEFVLPGEPPGGKA